MKRFLILAAAAAMLTGCGLSKPLERPGPMWGEEKAKYDAEQARLKAEQEAQAGTKPTTPGGDLPPPPPPKPAPTTSPVDAPMVP
jgi:hypothetical protein